MLFQFVNMAMFRSNPSNISMPDGGLLISHVRPSQPLALPNVALEPKKVGHPWSMGACRIKSPCAGVAKNVETKITKNLVILAHTATPPKPVKGCL